MTDIESSVRKERIIPQCEIFHSSTEFSSGFNTETSMKYPVELSIAIHNLLPRPTFEEEKEGAVLLNNSPDYFPKDEGLMCGYFPTNLYVHCPGRTQ